MTRGSTGGSQFSFMCVAMIKLTEPKETLFAFEKHFGLVHPFSNDVTWQVLLLYLQCHSSDDTHLWCSGPRT